MLRVESCVDFEKIENTEGLEHCFSPKLVCKPDSVVNRDSGDGGRCRALALGRVGIT